MSHHVKYNENKKVFVNLGTYSNNELKANLCISACSNMGLLLFANYCLWRGRKHQGMSHLTIWYHLALRGMPEWYSCQTSNM